MNKIITRSITTVLLVFMTVVSYANVNEPDCMGQFQTDWAYCDSIACYGSFWEYITNPGCAAVVTGCQNGALNRYNNCQEL